MSEANNSRRLKERKNKKRNDARQATHIRPEALHLTDMAITILFIKHQRSNVSQLLADNGLYLNPHEA